MKTLIFTTAVNTNSNNLYKENRSINDSDVFDIAKLTWDHYCTRIGADFYVIDKALHPDTSPHWFRYWIFDLKPGYDRYLYIDTDVLVKWNAPNIFEENKPGSIYAVHDNGGLRWIWDGIEAYKNMFPGVILDWDTYFNSGMLLQYRDTHKKGHDQTIFNYFLAYAEEKVELISGKWNLFHMNRREILHNGYFVDMGYFWHFNDIDRKVQVPFLNNVWNQLKPNYS
jgi:lipopolysaccharide biosynthesis glycosyltransferase